MILLLGCSVLLLYPFLLRGRIKLIQTFPSGEVESSFFSGSGFILGVSRTRHREGKGCFGVGYGVVEKWSKVTRPRLRARTNGVGEFMLDTVEDLDIEK